MRLKRKNRTQHRTDKYKRIERKQKQTKADGMNPNPGKTE